MNQCIFCKSSTNGFRTREHILPESLGGGDWAILPAGLYCDSCQNVFGSAIEQQALGDYPFISMRTFLGIPTKKRKAPWFDFWEGRITAGPSAGTFYYDPNPFFAKAFADGKKTLAIVPSEPRKPEFVCRTLLKMGLETLACHDAEAVFSERYDAARRYALMGLKENPWWYLVTEDSGIRTRLFRNEAVQGDDEIFLETVPIQDEANVFHIRLMYLDMICPLESRILPPNRSELEPGTRLFVV